MMRFGSEQITAINLEKKNIVKKITQNNNNTHRFLKNAHILSGKKLKIPHTFFEFFFCKIWVYTKNDDQVVPFLWYTYIFLQLQLTILFANKKAILLLFQFMTLSIFLTPQSTPFTKKRCLCAWIYEKHLILL